MFEQRQVKEQPSAFVIVAAELAATPRRLLWWPVNRMREARNLARPAGWTHFEVWLNTL